MGWKSCEYDGDKLTNILSIQVTNPDPRGRGGTQSGNTNQYCRQILFRNAGHCLGQEGQLLIEKAYFFKNCKPSNCLSLGLKDFKLKINALPTPET
jgi:hypothetical protein